METVVRVIVLLGLGVYLWAVVGLINPVWGRLPNRWASVRVWVVSVVLLIGASFLDDGDPTGPQLSSPEAEQVVSEPSTAASEPEPASAEARVRRSIQSTYRNPVDATIEGQHVLTHFDISDNLTANMIRGGAQRAVKSILEGVDASGVDFEYVTVRGRFPMVDQFGNTEHVIVVDVGYSRAILDRINWNGISRENIYTIADRARINPEFRTQE